MEKFVPGRRYMMTNQWGRSLDKSLLCTRRTESFVYFAREIGGEEWRRKAHSGYGEEYVEFDQGFASRIKGIKSGVKEIHAKNTL